MPTFAEKKIIAFRCTGQLIVIGYFKCKTGTWQGLVWQALYFDFNVALLSPLEPFAKSVPLLHAWWQFYVAWQMNPSGSAWNVLTATALRMHGQFWDLKISMGELLTTQVLGTALQTGIKWEETRTLHRFARLYSVPTVEKITAKWYFRIAMWLKDKGWPDSLVSI